MANGVTNWPRGGDPRTGHGGPCFMHQGFANQYPAPWTYRTTVSGWVGDYAQWNGDWVLECDGSIGYFGERYYRSPAVGPTYLYLRLYPYDKSRLDGMTVTWDVGFYGEIAGEPWDIGQSVGAAWPTNSGELPAVDLHETYPFAATPVTMTPAPWDYANPCVERDQALGASTSS